MATSGTPDPALFRLKTFEAERLREPLKRAAAGDALDQLLVVEAGVWVRLGSALGYFPADADLHVAVPTFPTDDISALVSWIDESHLPPEFDAGEFGQALSRAREDFTPERRELLRLALFGTQPEWDEAITELRAFKSWLEVFDPEADGRLASVRWALEGSLSDYDPKRRRSEAGRLPADWRTGSMRGLRDCSPQAAARIDEVRDERLAIAEKMQRLISVPPANAQLIEACRSAAAEKNWELFDALFRDGLMRGVEEYLCDYLGAWEEALSLARLGDVPSFAEQHSKPWYYSITVARCLKHLGESAESREKYLTTLIAIADEEDPDTALYINNFLTLLVWRGELNSADRLAEANVRALSWIKDDWTYCWQVEHGFSSIAYLKLLQGQLGMAETLFEKSAEAWADFDGRRGWVFDYYPYYRSELILLKEPTAYDKALETIELLLEVAADKGWPESICRGHIQAAVVHLDQASVLKDRAPLELASERLAKAAAIRPGMRLPDVEIAHHLATINAEFINREMSPGADIGLTDVESRIDAVDDLVRHSGLALRRPEVIAARGIVSYLAGRREEARDSHRHAVAVANAQGQLLAMHSPRSLVHWLGAHVGGQPEEFVAKPSENIVHILGARLDREFLVKRLRELQAGTGPDQPAEAA